MIMKFQVRRGTQELVILALMTAAALAQEANPRQEKKQDQDQTIRVATSLVEVRAVVTDKQGRPVTGLTASDIRAPGKQARLRKSASSRL